jgi:transcriptional regulator GlxA family with amidase domain
VRIDIVCFDGLDELDAIGPLEVFRNAAAAGADITVRTVTRVPVAEVVANHGLRFRPDGVYEPGADVVLVPGGGWAARSEVGVWGEVQRGDWLPLLAKAATDGVMASVCTGAMLLAHAGVIGSRPAATHHVAWADLEATDATLVKDRVVDDGNLVTAGGVTSGLDLSLWLVERFFSSELADGLAKALEYPRARPLTA